uniref:type IIG restriction enzyme/methyltransferase n=1 Tax=uncultured Chryseobacterium sp. TaxID=259322 RepID=UPI002589F923
SEVENFSENLKSCIEAINLVDTKNESEEHLKSPIKKFLSSTFYKDNEINTKDRIDLAVYLDKDANSDVGIIIEAKKPSNKSEFPTITQLNKKGFQEILLYYLRERVDHKNNNIKHLIITNGFEWFFFKASDFYNLFYTDKNLLKEYSQFRDGLKDTVKNELFYNEIAAKYINKVEDQLPFVYLNFRKKQISNLKQKEIVNIYKLFSDVHLLGKGFGNDSNQLNKAFYNELLHIIGLEETKENGKKVIKRKTYKTADYGPLLENTIFTLEDKDYLNRVKNVPSENKAFNVGLELCLTWVNRILFLKLLESQLGSYNGNSKDFKFLNYEFINGFDSLNELFFSALAKPLKDRHARYADKFKNIPYLNSSLFEKNALEELTFDITALMDEDMEVYSSTVLKNETGKKLTGKLNTLDYFFRFLDAYDFSADSGIESDFQLENKTLINASVLGLIFEKINGYRDGSFYTPGLITMFMCKETLRNAVTQKFKEEFDKSIETFDDVIDYCKQYFKKEYRKKFNEVINSIRICDPAVGSGHFLVSALNEMIAIKSELGILADENFNTLPCLVKVENDEIYILDANDELFSYNRKDPQSLLIQKAIFHEKETVIENCLFGVDINPNSVNICRLRLWIELLKNAYYTDEGELQTLPNIDINIKNGNSLISRFTLDDSLKAAFKNKEVNFSVADYKQAVKDYKTTNSKTKKREVEEIITIIKNNFKSTLDNSIRDKVSKAVGLYQNEEQRQQNLLAFGEAIKKTEKDNLKKLKQKAELAQKEKEEILNNVIYRNAFEWRFKFPEVLDDEGNFVGFDVIIGNPPYIQLQKMGLASDTLQKRGYETYAKTGDIYSLFYELGNNILKPNGFLTYITSNKWMRAAYGESLRKFFIEKTNPEILIDFGGVQIFDTATVDTNILMFSKDKNRQQTQTCIIKDKTLNNLSDYFRQNAVKTNFSNSASWVILSDIEKRIKAKIEAIGTPLKDWNINISRGILTGCNDAFIIDINKKNELIKEDPKSAEIIRPILRGRDIDKFLTQNSDKFLLFIPWHFPLHFKSNISGVSMRAEQEFESQYPSVYNHLLRYKEALSNRNKLETGVRYEWYALQRWGANYWEDFYKPKIVWKRVGSIVRFSYDDSNAFALDSTCFATGDYIKYLVCFLNSQMAKYMLKDSPKTGTGDLLISVQAIEPLRIPIPTKEINDRFEQIMDNLITKISNQKDIENQIDSIIYELLELNKEEIDFIESQ